MEENQTLDEFAESMVAMTDEFKLIANNANKAGDALVVLAAVATHDACCNALQDVFGGEDDGSRAIRAVQSEGVEE